MKTTNKTVNGIEVSCFRDPSTIYGEWVVQTANYTERYNNKDWTKKAAMEDLVRLEVIFNKLCDGTY